MSMNGVLMALEPAEMEAWFADPDHEPAVVEELDIEKSWDALHIMLSPLDDPWSAGYDVPVLDPILGGTPFAEDDGYGPPRFLDVDQVREVAASLDALGDGDLVARFDPDAFGKAGLYPNVWSDPAEHDPSWLLQYAAEVKAFYRRAADAGHCVVLSLL